MTLPEEFMHDPDVITALNALNVALDASLAARGDDVKTVVVVVHTTSGFDAGGLLGCECLECKRALADTFGQLIGAKAVIQKLPRANPSVKAVH